MDDEALFVEILPPSTLSTKPDRIEVSVATVDPQLCGPLLKALSKLGSKDEALAHLKRVKRGRYSNNRNNDSPPPKKKAKVDLEVLLGRNEKEFAGLIETYNLQPQRMQVPGRTAESKQELEDFNRMWPTIYFHKNTEEHKAQELILSEDEIKAMVRGMEQAVKDGAVIVNPKSGCAVSRSQDELICQEEAARVNPLCSPVLLAIQGVSRLEREAALGHGMDSAAFQTGQYLCTGYDIYLKREPDVFEAMALVHSRIRRVVFGVPNSKTGGIGGTGESSDVHSLPGTNHRYRAFVCASAGKLGRAYKQLDETQGVVGK